MNTPTPRFDSKVAFITGASDHGIGGAIAERFAKEGGRICIAGIEKPLRLLKRLKRVQQDVLYMHCDVTNEQSVQVAIQACVSKFERLDIVVNNAGVEILHRFEEFTEADSQQMLDVNLHGAIRVSRAAVPHLEAGAVLINIASALALGGCSAFSIYSASKAGLIGLTQSLAMELAPRKIRVTTVAPALVATPMSLRHVANLSEEGKKKIEASHPLGTATTHDVASAVAFLASDDAKFISGITLPVGFMTQYALPTDHILAPPIEQSSFSAAQNRAA